MDKWKGITIGGIPLEDFLLDEEEKEKKAREAEYRKSVRDHVDSIITVHKRNMPPLPRTRYADTFTTTSGKPRVSKRVRRLTREEIIKEYGMAFVKSKEAMAYRLVSLWKEKGELTAEEAAKLLNSNTKAVGTAFFRLKQAFGEDATETDKSTRPVVHILKPHFRRKSTEELYELHLNFQRFLYNKRKEKQEKIAPKPKPESKEKPTFQPSSDSQYTVGLLTEGLDWLQAHMVAEFNKLKEEMLTKTSNTIDININVNLGFKWLK